MLKGAWSSKSTLATRHKWRQLSECGSSRLGLSIGYYCDWYFWYQCGFRRLWCATKNLEVVRLWNHIGIFNALICTNVVVCLFHNSVWIMSFRSFFFFHGQSWKLRHEFGSIWQDCVLIENILKIVHHKLSHDVLRNNLCTVENKVLIFANNVDAIESEDPSSLLQLPSTGCVKNRHFYGSPIVCEISVF